MSYKRQPTTTPKKELTGLIVKFQASEPIQCKQQTDESRLPIKIARKKVSKRLRACTTTLSMSNRHASAVGGGLIALR